MAATREQLADPRMLPGTPGWREEARETFRLAWPLIIAQLAQMALITTDVIMMGWLGPRQLAAGTLASAFFHPLLLFGFGTLTAVAPMVAQAIGRRDFRSVRRSVRQGLWVSLVVAIVLAPILWQAEAIFILLEQDTELARLAGGYLRVALWLIFPSLMFVTLRCFLSAHGDTRVILFITLAAIVLNAAGNYVLMFGKFGFPRLELVGAAISTVIVNTANLVLGLAYVLRHRRYRRYALLVRLWKPDWPRFREILKIGLPIGLMQMAEVGLFAGAALLMGWLGTAELAAHAVALQCAALTFMVPLGLSMATTVRVGLAYGRGDRQAIARSGWTSFVMGTAFMGLAALLFWLAPEILVGVYLDPDDPVNHASIALAVSYLAVAALFQLVDGAQVVAGAALRGLSDTTVPMIVAILGYWAVGMPVAYVCGFVLDLRGVGIWLGLASGLFVVAVVLTARFAWRDRLGLTG